MTIPDEPTPAPAAASTQLSRVFPVALCTVVGTLVMLACVVPDPLARRVYDNMHWTLAYSAAAVFAWIGVHRAHDQPALPQRYFAWALTVYSIAQLLWDVQVAIGWNPFPGPSDALYICLGFLSGLGYLAALRKDCSPAQMRAVLLDSTGLTVAVLALVLALYLPRQGEYSTLSMGVLVAYPVVLFWAVCLGIITELKMRLVPPAGRIVLLLALLANTGLWLEWNSRTLDGTLVDGGPYNALFSVVAVTQGLGAMNWSAEGSVSQRWERLCASVVRLLPLSIVTMSAGAVVLTHAVPGIPALIRWTSLIGGMIVVTLAAIRQSVMLTEGEEVVALERALRQKDEAYRVLVEQAVDGIFVGDPTGHFIEVNQRGAAMLGMTRDQVIGLHISEVALPGDKTHFDDDVRRVLAGEEICGDRFFRRRDGTALEVEVRTKLLSDGRVHSIMRDVTNRKALEDQLRHAQKMDALSTLSAGIAHDFNNLLMTIRGYADLAVEELPLRHTVRASLHEISKASIRASQLVKQILTFSLPSRLTLETVRLQDVVTEVAGLLRSTLPPGIEIRTQPGSEAAFVSADAAQLHQVLVNLCTNAWQAIGDKPGGIDIEAGSVTLGDANAQGLPAGRYACLRVSDDGCGMTTGTRNRIFEPFFTTRRAIGGAGLGMAMVHGIVRTHRGAIAIESTPDEGTTVRIFLPAAAAPETSAIEVSPSLDLADTPRDSTVTGTCRVLFVDDEPALVTLAEKELSRRGYSVVGCTSARAAIAAAANDAVPIHVVVSDQTMPEMLGVDMLREIKQRRPAVRCILISGLADVKLRALAAEIGVDRVCQKPVMFGELCATIEAILAGSSDPCAPGAVRLAVP